MKKALIITTVVLVHLSFVQTGRKVPSVDVKTLDGKTFNMSTIENGGKPVIINFWATWCKPCKLELDNIAEVYDEWKKETGVNLIAIAIDDSRTSSKVPTNVSEKGWDYTVYMDQNQDFKRALNVTNPPHTFVVNGKGEIVWQHSGYQPGDENKLYEIVKKVANGEAITE